MVLSGSDIGIEFNEHRFRDNFYLRLKIRCSLRSMIYCGAGDHMETNDDDNYSNTGSLRYHNDLPVSHALILNINISTVYKTALHKVFLILFQHLAKYLTVKAL